MSKSRDVVIFFAGAVFFHTISHIMLPFYIPLPLNVDFMVLTPMLNWVIVIASAAVTVMLLWWASRLK